VSDSGRSNNLSAGLAIKDSKSRNGVRRRRQRRRLEAFNLENRANLGNPNGTFTATLFGKSTRAAGNPRQVEFGFRFEF
jgi:hypothetical protein